MLRAGLILGELLGYSLAFRIFLGIPFGVGPAVYASVVILGLYICDFAHLMKQASLAIHAGGAIALAACVVAAPRARSIFAIKGPNVLHWAVAGCVILLAVALNYKVNEAARFGSWDEFSHWGTIIRAIYEANTFHFQRDLLYFEDYPPGAALFSYHVLSLLGYTEGNAFFSYSLLMLCFLAGVLRVALRLGIGAFLIVSPTVYFLVSIFGWGWSNVLIDHVLGVTFAGCIVAYYSTGHDLRSRFAIPILLGAFVLIKHAGATMALLAACICVLDLLIVRVFEARAGGKGIASLRIRVSDLLWALMMFGVPLLVAASWKTYVTSAGLGTGWITYSPADYVRNIFTCCTSSREIEVASKFFAQLLYVSPAPQRPASLLAFALDAWHNFSFGGVLKSGALPAPGVMMAGLAMLGIATAVSAPALRDRVRLLALTGGMILGCIAYVGSLMLAYLYRFSDYEGRVLITFNRYLNVFLLAWLLVSLMQVMTVLARRGLLRKLTYAGVAACVVLAVFAYDIPSRALARLWPPSNEKIAELIQSRMPQTPPWRPLFSNWAVRINRFLPPNAKIYIIWQQSNGLELWVTKYEFLPRLTNFFCWSLGEPIDPDDMYPCRRSAEQVAEMIGTYDFVAVGRGLANLRKQYGPLFNDGPQVDAGLFKVEKTASGIELRYIETN